jgi:hypothetical protein
MKSFNKLAVSLGALAVIAGVGASIALQSFAQTSDTTTTTQTAQSTTAPSGSFDPTKGGHVGQNGKKEELLTGSQAEQAKAAALVAVPGGTIQRVETDAEGDVYEAHMLKADGTPITVKFDANFNVTKTENGPGPRPQSQTQTQQN